MAKFVALGAKTNAILFKMQHKMLNFDIFFAKSIDTREIKLYYIVYL